MLSLGFTGGKIYVGEGVKLRHYYVAVVCSDACREGCDALPVELSRDGHKLPAGMTELLVGEEVANHVDPAWIAYEDDGVGEFLRPEMDVESGTVGVDYELGFWYSHCGLVFNEVISNIRIFIGISYFCTMWQRIQTLYLAIAAGLSVALFFCVKSFSLGAGDAHVDELKYVQFFPYLILLILVTLLHLIALGSFNVRVLQMRTAVLAGLLLLALQGWLAVDYFTAADGVIFRWTAVFPIVAAILDFMAARCILRDQLLVESISRLRSKKKNHKI